MDLRRRAGGAFIEAFFNTAGFLGRAHPSHRDGAVERFGNLPYVPDGDPHHCLDVYRPRERDGVLPVVIYVHGGAFRILSKDTHWLVGVEFARAGFICFNINYRLAPRHPYPAALHDVADAVRWVAEHAALYGGDPNTLVLAGESAGANLTCAYTSGACFDVDEPIGEKIRELGIAPNAIMPSAGVLEVTRPERYMGVPNVKNWLIMDRIRTVTRSYTPGWSEGDPSMGLADPLVLLESDAPLRREWPATFIGCGEADPIADDSERLAKALWARGAAATLNWYARQPHGFQMMIWRDEAKQFWQDSVAFLDAHLAARAETVVG